MDMNEEVILEKKYDNWKTSFLLGALIGAVFFIGIFGIKVLDVTNDDWMTFEFDLAQHILGWRMYKNSNWYFPIGLCDTGMYPSLTSVVYTDSIPIVALLFKLISPILPVKFQYFGIFGLFSFMMQGGMAKIILRKYIDKEWIRNVGAVFFVTNIAYVQRMFWQTALSSHFLILMAIALYVYRNDIKSKKKRIFLWCGLGALTISIHFYLYGMVSVLLAGFALNEFLYELPKIKKAVIVFFSYLFSYLAVTVFTFYIFGGFYGTININNTENYMHSAYIDALFDSKKYSMFFKAREYDDGELEGLAYVGLAIIILLIPAFISFCKDIKRIWTKYRIEFLVILLLVIMFFAFSISPIVFMDGEYLFSIEFIPNFVVKYSWGIFRACGRFIWPVMYLFILIAIVYSERLLKKAYPVILMIMMCLQLIEFSGFFSETYNTINNYKRLNCPADIFNNYDLREYKHIQFMENYMWIDFYADLTCYYQFVGYARLAMDHRMTISNFHFARDYDKTVQEQIERCFAKLNAGKPDNDTLYVFPKEIYLKNDYHEKFDNVLEFDTGYDIVLIPNY